MVKESLIIFFTFIIYQFLHINSRFSFPPSVSFPDFCQDLSPVILTLHISLVLSTKCRGASVSEVVNQVCLIPERIRIMNTHPVFFFFWLNLIYWASSFCKSSMYKWSFYLLAYLYEEVVLMFANHRQWIFCLFCL